MKDLRDLTDFDVEPPESRMTQSRPPHHRHHHHTSKARRPQHQVARVQSGRFDPSDILVKFCGGRIQLRCTANMAHVCVARVPHTRQVFELHRVRLVTSSSSCLLLSSLELSVTEVYAPQIRTAQKSGGLTLRKLMWAVEQRSLKSVGVENSWGWES